LWEEQQDNLLDDSDFVKTLNGCMDGLQGNGMAAIKLKFLEEKTGEQICKELGITTTNFWQLVHRAKLQLIKCLEVHGFKE
jgi:RNA polymerase sigma-70 factor (ECF subfamily)